MWRKLLGILTLFSFLPYFSICQNKLRENGWYHILSGQTDSISKEPIVTTKDFIALKLDGLFRKICNQRTNQQL